MTEPQNGATYDDLLAVARRAEETGFDAFFRSDHYLTMGGDGRGDLRCHRHLGRVDPRAELLRREAAGLGGGDPDVG